MKKLLLLLAAFAFACSARASNFAVADFSGSSGADLSTKAWTTPNTDGWTVENTGMKLDGSGGVYYDAANPVYRCTTGAAPSADYTLVGTIKAYTFISANSFDINSRETATNTKYLASIKMTSSSVQKVTLYKEVGGTYTQLGSDYNLSGNSLVSASADSIIRLSTVGNQISVAWQGSGETTPTLILGPFTDSGITTAGKYGISGSSGTATASTGIHITSLVAFDYTPTPVTNTNLYFSPYNTYSGGGSGTLQSNNILPTGTTYAEWAATGAYLKFSITLSVASNVYLNLDTTTQNGIGAANCAQIGWFNEDAGGSVISTYQLVYNASPPLSVQIGGGLAAGTYRFYVYFKGWNLPYSGLGNIWNGTNLVRIRGVVAESSATFNTYTPRSKRLLIYGDSATAGFQSTGSSQSAIASHDALQTWVPPLARALDCEFGMVAYGGQGFILGMYDSQPATANQPSLYNTTAANQSWDKYKSGASRTTVTGQPAPDYIIARIGANDAAPRTALDNTTVVNWTAAVRAVWPNAKIYFIPNVTLLNRAAILSAANAVIAVPDTKSFYLTPPATLWTFGTGSYPVNGVNFWSWENNHPDAAAAAMDAATVTLLIKGNLAGTGTSPTSTTWVQ